MPRTGSTYARIILLIACGAILPSCAAPRLTPAEDPPPFYPHTRTVAVVDDYHGTRVADPYRWLENTDSQEVRAWAAAQNALAVRHLADDALRTSLVTRMLELAAPWDQLEQESSTHQKGGLEFAFTTAADSGHRALTIRQEGSEPRVFVDPKEFGPAMEIADYDLSPDERYVAYTLSDAGSEWGELRIRRTADARDLPEVMAGMLWPNLSWTRDGEGFFYIRYQRPAPGEHTMFHSPAVFHHRVGTPQSDDRAIFRTPERTTHLALGVQLTPDGRYALISEGEGAHDETIGWLRNRRWLLDLGDPLQPDPTGALVPLTPDRNSAYELVGQQDSLLYFLTDRGAPRRRLVAVNAGAPAADGWRNVIPESDGVLHSISEVHGRWVALYLYDVQYRVSVFERAGRPVRAIELPPLTSVLEVRPGPGDSELDLVTMSFLRPPGVARHDLASGTSRPVRQPPVSFDTTAFEARQVWYRSKDGVRVPMFVLHQRGIALDGSHPTVLTGYGASNQISPPAFGEGVIAWLELGGIIAVPNLRGGGEFGREWYEAAILERKQNTIDDFIAAAEWLIAQGYTSPARLAIHGASNGGLLVAATLTQRPELFAAAVAEVPMVDPLRYDRGRHRAQFGHAQDPAHFPFLLAYAPLQRIRPGTCYPATLVTTALNDDRAPAWHALKLTAALQAAQGCPRPVLLRAHDAGGHLGSRGPNAWIEEQAEQLAFLARRLGLIIEKGPPGHR